jgi:hypothetical protein
LTVRTRFATLWLCGAGPPRDRSQAVSTQTNRNPQTGLAVAEPVDSDLPLTHPGSGIPSFSEVVYAHFAWWQALRDGTPDERAEAAYRETLGRFEARHGELVNAYWCTNVESAVGLTERKRRFRFLKPLTAFHRETDWATPASPDIARELHRCDEIGVRARAVLRGIRQRICMQLVFASASHLLSLVDARAAHADEEKTQEALEHERETIADTERYYCHAANGQAQMVYFAGMATAATLIAVVSLLWLAFDWASPIAAFIAGAIGAVVSVTQRVNSGQFDLEYDVGSPYAFFLGSLRPLIGGAFALVISFAFTGGVLHLPVAANDPDTNERLALFVVSFLAGFSERWAQDTLATAVPAAGQADAD